MRGGAQAELFSQLSVQIAVQYSPDVLKGLSGREVEEKRLPGPFPTTFSWDLGTCLDPFHEFLGFHQVADTIEDSA